MFKLILLGALVTGISSAQASSFEQVYHWKTVDISWPSEEIYKKLLDSNEYIPTHNAIAGIKLWKKMMFLTFPRWREGVPVTLSVVDNNKEFKKNSTSPKVKAYPNWDMQAVGNCTAFQFVQSMEIDPTGKMWVLDTGRTDTLTDQPKARCPPRLVILDIENDGKIIKSFEFPSDVTSPNSSYLNDIVLDDSDGGFAYITDCDANDPGIIVYSVEANKSWKIRHDSMKKQDEAVNLTVNGTSVEVTFPIDGIALSQRDASSRYVYYWPVASYHMHSIPTSVLKRNPKNVENFIEDMGRKSSQSDGMMISSTGVLYFGLLGDDAVAMWLTNGTKNFNDGQSILSRDHVAMQWPDTFAFDDNGYLWCVTNSLQNLLKDQVNTNEINYRVLRLATGTKSYQY